MKKAMIALICVMLVLALGLTAVLVIGLNGGLQANLFSDENLELANRQTFRAGDVELLQINYRSERITLLPYDGDELILEEYMSDWDEAMLASTQLSGGQLSIQAGNRPLRVGLWMWRARIVVHLPHSWAGQLVAESSSGGIRSEGTLSLQSLRTTSSSGSIRLGRVETDKDVAIACSSGSFTCESIVAGGRVDISSSSGSIRPDAVTAQQLSIKNSSGSVRLGRVHADTTVSSSSGSIEIDELNGSFLLDNRSGSIRLHAGAAHGTATSSSGSIKIELSELTGDVSLSATSGSCRLQLPLGSAFHLQVQTGSGSIHTSDDDALHFNQKGNRAEGDVGTNPSHTVRMETSSGSARVEW